MSIAQYLAERDPIAGGVYVLMLIVFAGIPWVLGGERAAAEPRR